MWEHQKEPNIVGAMLVGWERWEGRSGKGVLVSQSSVKGPYCVGSSKDFGIYPEWT